MQREGFDGFDAIAEAEPPEEAENKQLTSNQGVQGLCCQLTCSKEHWRAACCGRGAWKLWIGANSPPAVQWSCCGVFWLFIGISLAIYLPVLLYYDTRPYECPSDIPEVELSVPSEAGYALVKEYSGPSFLDDWEFFTKADPTQGFVNYVSREEAGQKNLTYYDTDSDVWYLQTDTENIVADDARGRDSVRLHSKANYTYGVFLMELLHMPDGCASWPAWWMTNDPWPYFGEVDIIEQINGAGTNNFVGHTKDYCNVPADEDTFLGLWKASMPAVLTPSTDCTLSSNNQGCAAYMEPGTFGGPFNTQGGGAYALVWDETGMRAYFWSNSCGGIPSDLINNVPVPNSWGLPMARFDFSDDDCPKSRYRELYMVINLTFCGTWAGFPAFWARCALSNGLSSCGGYVKSNPKEFLESYWVIQRVKVYQQTT